MDLSPQNTNKEHDELTGQLLHFSLKPIVRLLARTSVTPNQVTALSIIPALGSIYFLWQGGYRDTITGAILAFLYVILDAIDGQLAREKNLQSLLGKWLDGILGYIFVPVMMLAAGRGLHEPETFLVGAIAALCFPLQFTVIYFFNSEIRKESQRMELPLSSRWHFLRYTYGLALFFPLLLLGAVLDKTVVVLYFFATAGHLFWLGIVAIQWHYLRRQEQQTMK